MCMCVCVCDKCGKRRQVKKSYQYHYGGSNKNTEKKNLRFMKTEKDL